MGGLGRSKRRNHYHCANEWTRNFHPYGRQIQRRRLAEDPIMLRAVGMLNKLVAIETDCYQSGSFLKLAVLL